MGIIPEPKRADLNRAHANLVDQNPNVTRGQTRLCFSFLNKQTCDKPDCTFRHLLPGHPDWVADKLKKGHSVPGPMAAQAAAHSQAYMAQMAQAQQMAHMQHMQHMQHMASSSGHPQTPQPSLQSQGSAADMYNMHMQMHIAGQAHQQHQAAAQQMAAQQLPPQAQQMLQQVQMQNYMQQQQQMMMMQMQHAGARPAGQPPPSSGARICFPFLNKGICARGSECKFRHLSQDHPDAVADRLRTGHVHRINPCLRPGHGVASGPHPAQAAGVGGYGMPPAAPQPPSASLLPQPPSASLLPQPPSASLLPQPPSASLPGAQ